VPNGENIKPNDGNSAMPQTRPLSASAASASATTKIRQAVVESQQYNIENNHNYGESHNNAANPRPPESSSAHPSSQSNPRAHVHTHVIAKPDPVHTIPKVAVANNDINDADEDETGDMGLDAAEIYDGNNKRAVAQQQVDDDEEMDGRPIQASRSQPEISIITASQSLDYGNIGSIGAPIDVRNSSIDSFAENDIDIGLSTVPNQFCTKRDALELRKLVVMTSQSRGGIVPSSSAVMDMYMVGKVIGVGSYGKVRAAWHRLTGAKIAIKTYDKAKMKDPSHWKRIYSEIKIMEQISHPRIARLYEAVETPKRMHLIMECSDGGNLCSYVKQKKRLSEEESKKIFFHIVQAIDYLHSLGVAHRDIKLENVLFTDQRDIKLIDFGFSTVCQPGKRLKVFCGTPSYMAPEIVNRLEYDGIPVDMWSLGILLYALLCGCFPFRAKTYPDLYRRIARGTFAIPDELSSQAKDLIRQLLNADVSQRMNSHAALRHPWLHSQFSTAPDMDKLRKETPILISDRASDDMDEETLNEIEKYGILKEDIVKTVLTKTHSAIATLYYLLLDLIVTRRKKQTGSSKHRSSSDRHKAPSSAYANANFNMYNQQPQNNYQYNPAYVLNQQDQLLQQQQQQHINMQQFQQQQQGGQARPRSASATRSGGGGQRPLSANGTRR
jgi:serine/threonine protein kinase